MAVAFDSVSPDTSSGAGVSSLTATAQTIAGSDRLAIGAIGTGDSTNTTHSHFKVGGSGGTDMASQSSLAIGTHGRVSAWSLVAPSTGSQQAFGDWAASQGESTIGMLTYTGVDQTTPISGLVTGTWNTDGLGAATPSINVTTEVGDTVVAIFFGHNTNASSNQTITAAGGATTRYDVPGTAIGGFAAILITELVATGTTTAMSATVASADTNLTNAGGIIAFVVEAAAAGGGPVDMITVPVTGGRPRGFAPGLGR